MIFYVDGACSGNPGKGGFGVVGFDKNNEICYTYSKFEEQTTNNRMELNAILHCLENFGKTGEVESVDNLEKPDVDYEKFDVEFEIPVVYSDSNYAVQTFNNWMYGWANNGWIKSDRKVPENLDIIKKYYSLIKQGYKMEVRKCAGHSGIKGNEIADALATGRITPKEVRKF